MTGVRTTPGPGQRSLLPFYLIVLAVVGLVFVLVQGDAGWSASVDLSHHYALAYRLSENWQLMPNDPTLGEMNVYPRLAHIVAAVIGTMLHSTLLGMQVVVLVSLVLVWGAFLLMLTTLPRRAASASALALAVLVYVNHRWFNLPVHGTEIVESYFFSQLAAQALALMVIAFAMRLERFASRWHAYALMLGALYVVAGTHLLPAIELLGVLAGLLVLDVVFPGVPAVGARKRALVPSVLLLIASVAMIVKHPAFAVMRGISENNGALGLVGFSSRASIVTLCAGALVVACCLLLAWWRDPVRLPVRKYLGVYGAALAALCLLQIVLVHRHIGSDYAVKKYVFGLVTFLFVALALFIGPLLARIGAASADHGGASRHPLRRLAGSGTFACAVFALAAGITVANAADGHKVFDMSDAIGIERQLIALRDTVLTAPIAGRNDVVVEMPNEAAALGYMFSIGIMHVPRDVALRDNFTEARMGPIAQYASIITGRGQGRYANFSSCSRTPGTLMVLDPECLQKAMASAGVCKGTFDFTTAGNVDMSMLTGFSGAEATFRWTDGKTATVTCEVKEPFRMAQLQISPFLTPKHQRQRAAISVNGGPAVNVDFNGNGTDKLVDLPLPAAAPGAKLVFTIAMPDAVSPQELGMGADGRLLGLAVKSLTFR